MKINQDMYKFSIIYKFFKELCIYLIFIPTTILQILQNCMELDKLRQRSAPTQSTTEALSTRDPRFIKCIEKNLFGFLLEKIENIHYTLKAKEREVVNLRKKFRMLSAYWRCKIKDLETKASSSK